MIIDYYARQKLCRIMAQSNGLTLRYEDEIDAPRTNGKVLWVPKPNAAWNEDEMALWEYKVEHETGHNDPDMRDIFDLAKEKNIAISGNFFGYVLNLLDDHRQERHKIDEFAGRRTIRSRGRKLFVENCEPRIGQEESDKYQMAADAMFTWDTKQREWFMPHVEGLFDRIESKLPQPTKDLLDKLWQFDNDLKNTRTAEDEYELTKRIINALGMDAEEEEKKAREAAQGEGEGKGGKDSSRDGDKEGKGGKDSSERGRGGDEKSDTDRARRAHFNDLLFHNHGKDEQYGPTFSPLSIDYTGYRSPGFYYPRSKEEMILVDFKKGIQPSAEGFAFPGRESYADRIKRCHTASGLASKVKRLLQIKSKSKYQYGMKRGKIHNKNVYRTCIRRK